MSLVIAIDGPSASGKGTIAKRVAAHFTLGHLDTGLLYRAVGAIRRDEIARAGGHLAAELGDATEAERVAKALKAVDLKRADLRSAGAGEAASYVAAAPGVRAALLDFQREFAALPPGLAQGAVRGAVLDGRDIGTIVCPDAAVKLFVTASTEERARRRCAELTARGEPADFDTVLAAIEARDKRDTDRAAAPLTMASDAYLLDTTDLDIDAAVAQAVDIVERVAPALSAR